MAFLVDAAAYFSTLRAAAMKAPHSIFVLGCALDSRTERAPEGAENALPMARGAFLIAPVMRRRELHVYLLNWNFVRTGH
jgi:phospholipase D1/2